MAMTRLPLISAFVDPFDLLYWISPAAQRRPSPRHYGDAGPQRLGERRRSE
jgi:hypothetical protein